MRAGDRRWVIGTRSLLFQVLAFPSAVVGLLALYWIVRLAVRHGVEDAWRRRERQTAEESSWDPARR